MAKKKSAAKRGSKKRGPKTTTSVRRGSSGSAHKKGSARRKAASGRTRPKKAVVTKKASSSRRAGAKPSAIRKPAEKLVPIVGVGASAGGLEAFTQLLEALPADSGMAFVLVSHLSHTHKSLLTEILAKATRMPVTQVTKRTRVEPSHVYVIPPNTDLAIENGVVTAKPFTKTGRPHMVIDHFLRSLAENRKSKAIGVILSGTGTDGTLGLAAIKAEGGITFAQDAKSAKYPDMPRSASAGGAADFILTPSRIADELTRLARHPYLRQAKPAGPAEAVADPEDALTHIFGLIRAATSVDFSYYKPTTIKRRISRRMLLHRLGSLSSYLKYLRTNPDEVEALYDDILISVTGFFRDTETFEVLQQKIIPQIMKRRRRDTPIRAWIPGCATGEEAYSVAICLLEGLGNFGANAPLQIFATDVSSTAIKKARDGCYPDSIALDLSQERLRRFFVKVEGGYQISKLVRDLCVFATQNVVKDPPFSRMDLISCRNVLIYLGPVFQKRALATFHYALKPSGFLVLGTSETVGASSDLFRPIHKKHKIFKKIEGAARGPFDFGGRELEIAVPERRPTKAVREVADIGREATQAILGQYVPLGVVVNAALDIVQFRGHTSPFLEPAPGEASLHLMKMAREGLLIGLRAAIHEARKTGSVVRREGLQVRSNGELRTVNLEVIPFAGGGLRDKYHVVLFEDVTSRARARGGARGTDETKPPKKKLSAPERELTALREELASTREHLHSVIEEQEAGNAELQSANEEILSSNEELQSTNEELETAKEELQATNEELTTVNEEMQNRNSELTQVNNDLINLIGSVDIIILMLGQDLRIRRFTPSAQKVMNLIPGDLGRPLGDIKTNLQVTNLGEMISDVIDSVTVKEQELQDDYGRWYSMRIRPYKTVDQKIDGAVLTLVDIDELKRTVQQLHLISRVFRVGADPIIVQDLEGRIIDVNEEAVRAYGWSRDELLGQPTTKIMPPDRYEKAGELWDRCKKAEALRNVDGVLWDKAGRRIPVSLTLSLLTDEEGKILGLATLTKHPKEHASAEKRRRAAQGSSTASSFGR